jgi:hypothetical protein
MNDIKTVRDTIKNKVSQLGTLSYVYDYDTALVEGTPFATITPQRGTSDWGDSAGSESGRNIQTMEFVVRVFQAREQSDFDSQKAENISLNVLDELLTAFHNDITLSGTVLWQRPTEWVTEYETVDQVVRTLQVTITAVKQINSK